MSNEVFNSFEIEEIFMENDFQKVFLCKEKESKMPFLVNAILDKRVSELLDLDKIDTDNDIFIKIFKSERILYIITKYIESPSIKEYLKTNKVSLSTQIKNTEFLFDTLYKLKEFPHYIINSMLNYNNILVDDDELKILGLIILDKDYSEFNNSKIYNTIANSLSVIFTGKELNDSKLDRDIPPDIKKIINKCLEGNYEDYFEIIDDFKTSKLYSLINPEAIEASKFHEVRKHLTHKRNMFKFKRTSVYIAIVLILLSPFIIKGMKGIINGLSDKIETNGEDVNDNSPIISDTDNNDIDEDIEEPDVTDNNLDNDIDEDIDRYFNEDNIDYGIDMYVARTDNNRVHKGNTSLYVENTLNKPLEYLVSTVDLNSDEFNYLNNKNANFSLWLNGKDDYNGEIIIKIYKEDKLVTTKSEKVFIPKDTWTMHNISSNIQGDLIKLYVKIDNGSLWIDTFDIDILK